jgi:uncharacterized protein YbaR (Trm112 family)
MSTKHHKLPPELLQVLACPLTKEPLKYDEVNNELVSEKAGLAFPIIDGIPVMLIDRARKI